MTLHYETIFTDYNVRELEWIKRLPVPRQYRWYKLLDSLIGVPERTDLIVQKVLEDVEAGRRCIVVTNRLAMCETLHERFAATQHPSLMVHGKLWKEARRIASESAQQYDIVVVTQLPLIRLSLPPKLGDGGVGFTCLHFALPSTHLTMYQRMQDALNCRSPGDNVDVYVRYYVDDHPWLRAAGAKNADVFKFLHDKE